MPPRQATRFAVLTFLLSVALSAIAGPQDFISGTYIASDGGHYLVRGPSPSHDGRQLWTFMAHTSSGAPQLDLIWETGTADENFVLIGRSPATIGRFGDAMAHGLVGVNAKGYAIGTPLNATQIGENLVVSGTDQTGSVTKLEHDPCAASG